MTNSRPKNCLTNKTLWIIANLFVLYLVSYHKIHLKICALGQANFFRKNASNSTVKFGPNRDWRPIFSQFGSCLTTRLGLGSSRGRANSDRPSDLRSLCVVVKRLPNCLKIGVQVGFGPNFPVEFEAFFQKKFGQA